LSMKQEPVSRGTGNPLTFVVGVTGCELVGFRYGGHREVQ
jgi:hypothetical protein